MLHDSLFIQKHFLKPKNTWILLGSKDIAMYYEYFWILMVYEQNR